MISAVLAVITDEGEVYACAEIATDTEHLVLLGSWALAEAPRIPLASVRTVVPVMLSDGPSLEPSDLLAGSVQEWAEGRGYRMASR